MAELLCVVVLMGSLGYIMWADWRLSRVLKGLDGAVDDLIAERDTLRTQLAAAQHNEEELESWIAQLREQLAAAERALARLAGWEGMPVGEITYKREPAPEAKADSCAYDT
jgi:hypothetical protein